ncbi:aspartyl-phosphate phosphatase Spo0E family protein [Virgibacillus sp. JSM 102003]|uniref:aspartyl-phosphate phosphatase Spo0E family protein n=1 Tax=Virgibacillus sp. JSM 102003 TaxID=1562108 RepID=UPI0035C0B7C9
MFAVIEPTRTDLSKEISMKKEEMIELGMKYGLANKRTIECSQQLDDLLNEHFDLTRSYYTA